MEQWDYHELLPGYRTSLILHGEEEEIPMVAWREGAGKSMPHAHHRECCGGGAFPIINARMHGLVRLSAFVSGEDAEPSGEELTNQYLLSLLQHCSSSPVMRLHHRQHQKPVLRGSKFSCGARMDWRTFENELLRREKAASVQREHEVIPLTKEEMQGTNPINPLTSAAPMVKNAGILMRRVPYRQQRLLIKGALRG